MEVVPAADVPLALPFARSNVQEWSHLDQLTGVLQQGRVQAHHWASATRAYGKVVDSRRVASASGGLEQRRLQQVEVFQERGPGGSRLHVVRASRHSSSSSSTTTNTNTNNSSSSAAAWRKAPAFDNLQLPLNPLDSSPQKTRASVGRSGSIGGRRPPSRPRSLVGKSEATAISEEHHDLDLDHNHDDDLEIEVAAPRIEASTATSSEDDDGGRHDRSPASARRHSHSGVARKKSSSTEELHCGAPDEGGQAEADSTSASAGPAEDWRRDARVRRSLQFPGKAPLGSPRLERPELPAFKSGSALRGLEALESVFRRGANIADSVNRTLADGGAGGDDALDVDSLAGHLRHEQQMASSEEEGLGGRGAGRAAAKRHSFVTVEKLKEVRGRLRRLGSPPSDEASADAARSAAIAEERDDGIVTEEPDKREDCGPAPRVRPFVYGLDAAARKTVPGTGSLESRTSNRSSSSSGSRSEEWYNRRKSYGFEQVHEPGREAQLYGSTFRDKNKVESSTDSGICRSSETVTPWGRLVGSRTKTEDSHSKTGASTHIPVSPLRASHSIAINKASISVESSDTQRNAVQDEDSAPQRGRSTVVTLGSKFEHRNVDFNNRNSGDSALHNASAYNSDDDKTNHRRFSEPVTITIPITREDSAAQSDALSNVEQKKQFYRQLAERPLSIAEGNKPFVVNIKKKETNDLSSLIDKRNSFSSDSTQPLLDSTPWRKTESWRSSKQEDGEMKRHSIAEDPRYAKGGANHIMSFSQMSQNDNSEQTFTRISASELAKKFDSLSVSRKEHSQSTLQNGIRQFSAGINVSFVQNGFGRNEEDDEEFSSSQMNMKKHKKVEFCKTEVHFVADSGRVNIVETDEKPPPTNMFRRRKRNNAAAVNVQPSDPNKSNLPQVRFGDSPYEKQLLGGNDSSVSEVSHTIHVDIASDAKVVSAAPAKEIKTQIPGNFQHDADKEDHIFTQANATISATVKSEGNESPRFDNENSDAFQMQGSTDKDNMPRSILKNYRKPRPFLLGENDDLKPKSEAEEGKQEEKWGVRLRPVQSSEQGSSTAMWRSQVSVSTTAFDVPQTQRPLASVSSLDHSFRDSENELQRQLRLLRPAHKKADAEAFSPPTQAESRPRSSPPVTRSFSRERETEDKGVQVTVGPAAADGAQLSAWTVAERIRQVEEMRKASGEVRGFSTRVNFGAGEATVIEAGSSDEQQSPTQKPAGGAFEKTSASKAPWSPRQEAEGYSRTAHEEEVRQLSTVRPPLPTYDSGRLRSVETLVSTRSGHPKITSISLHYEGDPAPADNSKPHSVHSSPKEVDSSSPLSAYSPRSEKQHQDKLSVSTEKTILAEDQTLYKQTAPPQQKDAAHKMYDVAAKARAPISYTERCYGDGESGSMSRRSRKSQENDRTYVVERKRFELQKEKYASERDGHVTGKDSTNEDSKSVTPRGSNTYVKERSHDYKSGKVDARRQIVETETCEEVKIRSTRERRSVSPEKAYSKDVATVAQKSETLKSTSTVSVEEDEYCGQDVSDDSESAEETYGSITDKKIAKRNSPIYDNVCGTGDRPKQSEAGKKAGTERQIAGKSSAVVKGQSASSSRKVTAVEKRSSRKASEGTGGKRRSESPIYENREIICLEKDRMQQQRTRQEQRQHETAMLEELTRAADQILQAVNGYSDDDSNRASSAEDEDRGRRHRRRAGGGGAALCTISEAPPRKGHRQPAGAAAAAGAAARRPQRAGAGRQQLGPTSSTSSVDSVSERRAAAVAATAARRERAARLVQRASSREQLLQARASSSEDALSSLEAEERRPRPPPPRRQRPAGTAASSAAARAQPPTQGHKRLSGGDAAAAARTADRTTTKKSLTSHRLRESTKERSTRTVSAKRDLAEVKHNTTRAATDKLAGSSHGLLPSSSKSKNERCISERRTVVAVMPLRPSPSSNVKKLKTTSSRTEGTQAKPVK